MIARGNGRAFECLVVDINTQRDFCEPDGAFAVANVHELIPQLRHMIAWTKRNGAPIVSSIESHRPLELSDSGNPIHCVDGSGGQQKLDFTIFPLHARTIDRIEVVKQAHVRRAKLYYLRERKGKAGRMREKRPLTA